jgi:acyl carrier protein
MSSITATLEALQLLTEQVRGAPLPEPLRRETRFVDDLGMASVELIGLVFLCEQRFVVELVNQRGLLATLKTAGLTIDAIERLKQARATGAAKSSSAATAQETA